MVGIADTTVTKWGNSDWFKKRLEEVRREANRILDRKITVLVDKSLAALEDRLENGDAKLVMPKGPKGEHSPEPQLVRVPLTASTLTIMTGVLLDKRAAIRKDDSDEQATPTEAFQRMADKLREFARTTKSIPADVVDVDAHEPADNSDLE